MVYLTTFCLYGRNIMRSISELEMSNFSQDQGKQRLARRRTDQYAAQAILKLDADIVEKGHL